MKIINGYAGGHKYLILIGRILAAVSAAVALVPYYDIWKILKIAAYGEDPTQITSIAWQAVILTIASLLIYIAALFCTHIAAFRIQANMRHELMSRIIKLPLGVFDEDGTGKIRRTVNDSTAATETYIAHNLPDKAVAWVTPVGLIVLLGVFDWKLGLVCLIPAVIGFAFIMSMMGKTMKENMVKYQNSLDIMSSEATEYVRGIPVVKIFGQSVYSFKRFKEAIDDFGKWSTGYTIMVRPKMAAFMTCINSIFAFIVGAAFCITRGGVTPEIILNVMYYIIVTPLLTVTLTKIAYSGEQEMVLADALSRIDSVLEIEPLDNKNNSSARPKDHSIVLDNVSFHYKDSKTDAVHNMSFTINEGEHVALVGPSGGGKSTTAALIARFFDVTGGAIRIGGVDIKDIPQDELMEYVSFVFQDSRLIKTSILENVRMAKPEASEAEVMEALYNAQCMDIIEKLPKGIHTVIGEKGTYLSGGEMQRISIARAMLKNAPILILDEATAFADPDNEARVQAAFERLSEDKTLIMIAHRLSTVIDADRIYVINDGSVVESGTHDELMRSATDNDTKAGSDETGGEGTDTGRTHGLYREMFEEYTRSISWKVGA